MTRSGQNVVRNNRKFVITGFVVVQEEYYIGLRFQYFLFSLLLSYEEFSL